MRPIEQFLRSGGTRSSKHWKPLR